MNQKTKEKKPVEKPAEKPIEKPKATESEKKEVQIIEKVIDDRTIAPIDAFGKLTRKQVELIKRTIARGASDDELKLFIQVCKGAQLNPFLKQVHLVKRWSSKEGREVATIQVGIDGYRSVAESSGNYAGNDDPIYDGEEDLQLGKEKIAHPLKATVTVFKIVGNARCPFTATARWKEYYPGEKMGFQWHIRPYLMLGKCAEALALRKAFPKLLSGMYAEEEMGKADTEQSEEQKMVIVFNRLKAGVKTASEKELKEIMGKMTASNKYTKEQKSEFTYLAQERIKGLKKKEVPEEGIPVIESE